MSKYNELQEKLKSNHAVCEAIKAELKTIQPPEMWVVFYKDEHKTGSTAHASEGEANESYPSLQEKIVRYILPVEPTNP